MSDWTIATWNVNSLRTRLEHVLSWADTARPDVLCLQETKVTDGEFPAAALREAGWWAAFTGQPAYNGVALMAREPLDDVAAGFPGDPDPSQARVLAGTWRDTRVVTVYVPNGSSVGSEKYEYKLAWLAALRRWLARDHDPARPLVLLGDFNVAPEDRDVYAPAAWQGRVLCSEPERRALQDLLGWGLVDLFRRHHPEPGLYSWWDYRQGRFRRDHGLRIDLALGTAPLAERSTGARIDKAPRAREKPSDHAPVVLSFAAR